MDDVSHIQLIWTKKVQKSAVFCATELGIIRKEDQVRQKNENERKNEIERGNRRIYKDRSI